MKRGEVYWNHWKDHLGQERKKPVLIISNDEYNQTAAFVTSIWLAKVDQRPGANHIHIPDEAFTGRGMMSGCVALCETVNSTKQCVLEGPIDFLNSEYWMSEVSRGIRIQCGMEKAPIVFGVKPEQYTEQYNTTYTRWDAPPFYSAANSPQLRETGDNGR